MAIVVFNERYADKRPAGVRIDVQVGDRLTFTVAGAQTVEYRRLHFVVVSRYVKRRYKKGCKRVTEHAEFPNTHTPPRTVWMFQDFWPTVVVPGVKDSVVKLERATSVLVVEFAGVLTLGELLVPDATILFLQGDERGRQWSPADEAYLQRSRGMIAPNHTFVRFEQPLGRPVARPDPQPLSPALSFTVRIDRDRP